MERSVIFMPVLDIAKLIIEIEEAVNPESEYYGKLVKWWERDKNLYHYGIGLSNTHLFNLGTADDKDMQVLKRHDIIKQGNLDIRVISNISSPFEDDEIIERLKYALRWLNDLPKDSSNQSIGGKALAGLIFKDNEKWKHQENELIHNEIDYKSYLKLQSPSLKYNKFGFPKKGKKWANYFLILLFFLGIVIAFLTDSIPFLIIDEPRKLVLVVVLLWLIIAVVALTSNIVSNFKWSGFQKKSLWDWLQLLVVPSMLAFGAFYLNYSSEARDKKLADEQHKQEVVKDYFSKMQSLILEEKRIRISETPSEQIKRDYYSKNSSSSKDQQKLSPESQSIARALTLAVLDEVNGSQKGKIIAYLAEAGLIEQPTPAIRLNSANLKEIILEDINLDKVMINYANMTGANMTDVTFRNSDISYSDLSNSTLKNVNFNNPNYIEDQIKAPKTAGVTKIGSVNLKGSTIIDGNFNFTNLQTSTTTNKGLNFDGATLKYTTEDKAKNFKSLILNSDFSNACFSGKTHIKIEKQQDWLNWLNWLVDYKKEQDWFKKQVGDKKIIEIAHGEQCLLPLKFKAPPIMKKNLDILNKEIMKENLNEIKPP
jgi:uncharacterized protein YjbI with pentapeptide repeats